MQLFDAHRQWATRPADQRFWSPGEMHTACLAYAKKSREVGFSPDMLRFRPSSDRAHEEVTVESPRLGTDRLGPEREADLTHYAFGQICRTVSAPADYLATLDAELAAKCLDTTWLSRARDVSVRKLLVMDREGRRPLVRCATSNIYVRVWNHEIAEQLVRLGEAGWKTPPARPVPTWGGQAWARPAREEDLAGLHSDVKIGDMIAPAGLYASDRDMFAFMVNPAVRVEAAGSKLTRGFFVRNSEVASGALAMTSFYYDEVCGNHIIWGAMHVEEVNLRHVGRVSERWNEVYANIEKWTASSSTQDAERIERLASHMLGKDLDEIDALLRGRHHILRAHQVNGAWEAANGQGCPVDPRSAWGFVWGLTRYSQYRPYANERVALDNAGGRILKLAEGKHKSA